VSGEKGNSNIRVGGGLRLARLVLLAATVFPVATAVAQPSTHLAPYVLFAQDSIRIRSALIKDGDVGVNDGLLYTRGAVAASQSDFVGGATHLDSTTDCEDLFTNVLVGGASRCPQASGSVPRPVVANVPQGCSFPSPFPACDPSRPVLVDHNQTIDLPLGPSGTPGIYGDLVVQGGGSGPAVLKLAPGEYHFCSVRVGRNGSVLFRGPTTVDVTGQVRMSNATDIGPDSSLGAAAPPPGAIKWYVQGTQVRYSRKGNIGGYVCAPTARMSIGSSVVLKGQYVARSIRLKRSTVTYTVPIPGVCGDTVVSPGEQCERNADCGAGICVDCSCQSATTTTTTTASSSTTTTTVPPECDDDADCNHGSVDGAFVCEDGHCVPACDEDSDCIQGSPQGAFVCDDGHCVPPCDADSDCNQDSTSGAFVCVDGHCVPGGSSTTSTTTTTTSTSTSSHSSTTSTNTTTTSTSLAGCRSDDDCPVGRCVDGVCTPECEDNADCNVGSPTGALVCVDGRCQGGEVCDDCTDNDGDGLVDFEDPDCCSQAAGVRFEMQPKKGRFRQVAPQVARLLLKGALARSGLGTMIDPPSQQISVQIRNQSGEVLCARIPAGKFRKTKKGFRYARKKSPLPVELGRNLDGVRVKVSKNGQVRFRVKGRKAQLTTPAEGTLEVTVGFLKSTGRASQNVCSHGVRLFRGGKKSGALRFP